MRTFTAGGKSIVVFSRPEPEAPVIYLHTVAGEGEKVLQAAQHAGCPPFHLVAIGGLDWDHDMAPWDSPPILKNASPCTGGADAYLTLLTSEILPQAEQGMEAPRWRGIAGYSLAGLFAVYALYQTDVFSRAASMSGSFWFPGFQAYIHSHAVKRRPDCLYFSLGNKEHKTRNPVLRTVRQNTEELYAFYRDKGLDTVFQIEEGNHYTHAVERTAAGIAWLLNR
ncbi:MAG: alpha/beta hydrolase-fold protein [Butyricicoccus sp.]|nr:alpha/beta hydrolase-fold protein [Butyricicoccus sp.]